jgi:hypothetical protein
LAKANSEINLKARYWEGDKITSFLKHWLRVRISPKKTVGSTIAIHSKWIYGFKE